MSVAAFGCGAGERTTVHDAQHGADSGADDRADCSDEGDVGGPVVEWNPAGITLTICGGSDSFAFGLADTSAGGWIGEDCIPGNNATADGGTAVERCHQAAASGGSWRLCDEAEFNADEDDGCTRLTAEDDARYDIAYVLMTEDLYNCWTWGAAGYYESFGYSCDSVD